jgi:hypothetical protein
MWRCRVARPQRCERRCSEHPFVIDFGLWLKAKAAAPVGSPTAPPSQASTSRSRPRSDTPTRPFRRSASRCRRATLGSRLFAPLGCRLASLWRRQVGEYEALARTRTEGRPHRGARARRGSRCRSVTAVRRRGWPARASRRCASFQPDPPIENTATESDGQVTTVDTVCVRGFSVGGPRHPDRIQLDKES